ncbi:hypothetical protein ABIB85_005133 [Bradyrhizobium sp. JR1.5]
MLFEIERINGQTPEQRLAARREQSRPLIAELEIWMRQQRALLSAKNDTANCTYLCEWKRPRGPQRTSPCERQGHALQSSGKQGTAKQSGLCRASLLAIDASVSILPLTVAWRVTVVLLVARPRHCGSTNATLEGPICPTLTAKSGTAGTTRKSAFILRTQISARSYITRTIYASWSAAERTTFGFWDRSSQIVRG